MASIAHALARIKDDVRTFVFDESIRDACRKTGHRWRERQLGPVQTVHLFVLQVIHFNTAIRHLRHLAGHAVNAAAYCEARMRLPLGVLRSLLRDSAASAVRSAVSSDRWCGLRVLLVESVETHFAELKTTLRMRRIKSQTPDGVRKELAIYCLVYNLVRRILVHAAEQQGTTPDRVSFIDALRWLLSAATPGEAVALLVINPRRPGRHEPRVIKDLQDTYRKMTLPRWQMRRRLDLAKR